MSSLKNFDATCPHCKTDWELNEEEQALAEFQCPECKQVFCPGENKSLVSNDTNFKNLICKRYSDAFTDAKALIKTGNSLKRSGGVLASLIVMFSLIIGSSISGGTPSFIIVGYGFLYAGTVGIPIYGLGILTTAQGQIALASLETAVNSSRHLTNNEVAQVLTESWNP